MYTKAHTASVDDIATAAKSNAVHKSEDNTRHVNERERPEGTLHVFKGNRKENID